MQSVLSRNWTHIAVSISCEDNYYTTGTSWRDDRLKYSTTHKYQNKRDNCLIRMDYFTVSFIPTRLSRLSSLIWRRNIVIKRNGDYVEKLGCDSQRNNFYSLCGWVLSCRRKTLLFDSPPCVIYYYAIYFYILYHYMLCYHVIYILLYVIYYHVTIGLMSRGSTNGPEDCGSIPSCTKDSKMVLDAALFNTQHYKVMIKGKVEQSREWSSTPPTLWCSNYWKGSFQVTLD